MHYETDFIRSQIENLIRSLSVFTLRKKSKITLPSHFYSAGKSEIQEGQLLEYSLKRMVDAGQINEAETFLFNSLESNPTSEKAIIAMEFYSNLSALDEAFLEMNGFSRQEIIDGLNDMKKLYT